MVRTKRILPATGDQAGAIVAATCGLRDKIARLVCANSEEAAGTWFRGEAIFPVCPFQL